MKFSDLNKPKLNDTSKIAKEKVQIGPINKEEIESKDPKKEILKQKSEIKESFENLKTEKEEEGMVKDVRFSIKRNDSYSQNIKIKKDDFAQNESEIKEEIDEDFLYARSKRFYDELVTMNREAYACADNQNYLKAYDTVMLMSDYILKNIFSDNYILNLLKYLTPQNYLYSHTLNVSILSGLISAELGYAEKEIREVVISSLCYDLGMLKHKNFYSVERALNKEELNAVKNHVEDGVKIVEKIFSFEPELKDTVSEITYLSHERADGSGYFGLSSDKITEKSQIIAVSDVYEAMTHRRTYRDPYEQPSIIYKFMQDFKKSFNQRAVKGLISVLSVYPPQSIVRLSTGEICKPIIINPKKPTRPVVKVIAGPDFDKVSPFILDLTDYPLTSIDTWVRYKDMFSANPDLYREEEVLWLWIDW